MSEATKMARLAGETAATNEPHDRRTPDACPFEVGTEERTAWLEGFADALEEQPDPVKLAKAGRAAIAHNKEALG